MRSDPWRDNLTNCVLYITVASTRWSPLLLLSRTETRVLIATPTGEDSLKEYLREPQKATRGKKNTIKKEKKKKKHIMKRTGGRKEILFAP